ncbi:hypothetical protein DFA_08456 [Cavenderia fasciculata]|uniref:Ribosomal protein L1 n=1 Tax=Cavenderia fasciculata TaxID=261658 RepID=F4Q687_CACFS|nr:uncharacterized protein DFA_08456 [Cavenderia fasciculata]EGG17461.1 hypothetical protein DFA_08456 [Cavenderia fasciculata]|eukprot:XP_004355945.1 hypothetical protein DFA_08456 [Cavenderia fasciculata]
MEDIIQKSKEAIKALLSAKKDESADQFPLPNSLYTGKVEVCIFVDNNEDDKKKLESTLEENAEFKSTVLSLKSIKESAKQYEDKRKLRDSHDIFIGDKAIKTALYDILGKTFFKQGTKNPRMVNTKKKVQKVLNIHKTTSAKIGQANYSVKFGGSQHTLEQMIENLQAVLKTITGGQDGKGMGGVSQLSIKNQNSPSFPIYLTQTKAVKDAIISNATKDKKAAVVAAAAAEPVEKVVKKQKNDTDKKTVVSTDKKPAAAAKQVAAAPAEKKSTTPTKAAAEKKPVAAAKQATAAAPAEKKSTTPTKAAEKKPAVAEKKPVVAAEKKPVAVVAEKKSTTPTKTAAPTKKSAPAPVAAATESSPAPTKKTTTTAAPTKKSTESTPKKPSAAPAKKGVKRSLDQ